jgi:hypothetical protein
MPARFASSPAIIRNNGSPPQGRSFSCRSNHGSRPATGGALLAFGALQDLTHHRPPVGGRPKRLQRDRLLGVEQLLDRHRAEPTTPERGLPPAGACFRGALQQQDAQRLFRVARVVGELAKPAAEPLRMHRGIVDHDQGRSAPAPVCEVLLVLESPELLALDEARRPAVRQHLLAQLERQHLLAQLERQPRLARTRTPGQHPHRDPPAAREPRPQRRHLRLAPDQRDRAGIGAQQVGLGLDPLAARQVAGQPEMGAGQVEPVVVAQDLDDDVARAVNVGPLLRAALARPHLYMPPGSNPTGRRRSTKKHAGLPSAFTQRYGLPGVEHGRRHAFDRIRLGTWGDISVRCEAIQPT